MTEALCVAGCSRPVRGAYLCRHCASKLEKALGQVPWLAEQLEITETKQDVLGQRGNHKPKRKENERPWTFNRTAEQVREDVTLTLTTWAHDLHHGTETQPPDNLTSLAPWLASRIERIRQHTEAADINDQISYAINQMWNTINRPSTRRIDITSCLNVDCPGKLRANIPVDDTRKITIGCTHCDAEYDDPIEWRRLGKRIIARDGGDPDSLIPAPQVAALLGWTTNQLRVWRHRDRDDRLPVATYGSDGTSLFRREDVQTLIETWSACA